MPSRSDWQRSALVVPHVRLGSSLPVVSLFSLGDMPVGRRGYHSRNPAACPGTRVTSPSTPAAQFAQQRRPPSLSNAYAVAGYPAITVPAGLSSLGSGPIGLTFVGGYLEDADLVGYAYAFESASALRQAPPTD
jgi:hypothetical protein